jgi:uncharacterized protein (TIGR03067 family)
MKTQTIIAGALTFLIAGFGSLDAGDDAKDEAIKKDRKRYEGTWRVASLVIDGTEVAEADKILVVTKADGSWLVKFDGKEVAGGTSTIDPTAKPKAFDLKVTQGPSAGKTVLGIYEGEQDSRKLCLANPDERRPTVFASKPGSGLTLVTFKREKP